MNQFELSKNSLNQARKSIHERIYKIFYDSDKKQLHYFYTTEHLKNPKPEKPSPYWTDYSEIIDHRGVINVFEPDGDCRHIRSVTGIFIRNLNNSKEYILEYIPLREDQNDFENYIHAEILEIEFKKLGIDCSIELKEFNNIKKIIYIPITEHRVHDLEGKSFKQFVITPKSDTDEAQFLFYFNNCIFNIVKII